MGIETLTSNGFCFAWPLLVCHHRGRSFFCYLKHICNAEKPWKYWSFFNLVTDNRCLYIFGFGLKKYIRKSIKRKYPVWSVICYLTPWNPGVFRALGALHICHFRSLWKATAFPRILMWSSSSPEKRIVLYWGFSAKSWRTPASRS